MRGRHRMRAHAALIALARVAQCGQRRAMPPPSPILPPPDGPASEPVPAPPVRRAGPALYMLVAVALFALMDAGLKSLSPHYPALQVATLRGAAALPLVLAWSLATVGARGLLRVHWPLHLLRGVLGVALMAGFVYGVRTLPLTTAYAISFVAPLLVTAMAVPILGEKVGPRRWAAI